MIPQGMRMSLLSQCKFFKDLLSPPPTCTSWSFPKGRVGSYEVMAGRFSNRKSIVFLVLPAICSIDTPEVGLDYMYHSLLMGFEQSKSCTFSLRVPWKEWAWKTNPKCQCPLALASHTHKSAPIQKSSEDRPCGEMICQRQTACFMLALYL